MDVSFLVSSKVTNNMWVFDLEKTVIQAPRFVSVAQTYSIPILFNCCAVHPPYYWGIKMFLCSVVLMQIDHNSKEFYYHSFLLCTNQICQHGGASSPTLTLFPISTVKGFSLLLTRLNFRLLNLLITTYDKTCNYFIRLS